MFKNKFIIQNITAVVAFCSIIYELLFSQVLTVIFGSSVVMYSLTIGIFLFSLGLGSLLFEKLKKRDLTKFFFQVELLLSIIGIVGIPFILLVNSFELGYILAVILSFIPVVLIGILSGFEIPILMGLNKNNSFGNILGIDYFGALIGTVLYSLFLYPVFGLFLTVILITFINLITAVLFLIYKKKIKWYLILLPILFYILLFSKADSINKYFENKYWGEHIAAFYNQFIPDSKKNGMEVEIIKTQRTPYQAVVKYNVMTKKRDNFGRPFWSDECLNLDSHVQLCKSWYQAYNQGLVDIPISFFTKEKKISVLLLGGGDFIPADGFRKLDDRIKEIDMVDLDPDFRDFAKKELKEYNNGAWDYKKLNIITEDAFTFLKKNNKKYDLILFDLPGAKSEKMLPLYSVEMFSFIHNALAKDGIFVKWTYPENEFSKHYNVVNNNLIKAGFKKRKNYYSYNIIDKGHGEYFSILSDQDVELKDETEYLKKWKEKITFENDELVEKPGVRVSTVFRPNYDLIVQHIFKK